MILEVLEYISHTLGQLGHAKLRGGLSINSDRAFHISGVVAGDKAVKAFAERRFAAPVASGDGNEIAAVDGEMDLI
ncbi:hypothetical protein D3C77_748400 [compost metagenome]